MRWREWNHLFKRVACVFPRDLDVVRIAWSRGSSAHRRVTEAPQITAMGAGHKVGVVLTWSRVTSLPGPIRGNPPDREKGARKPASPMAPGSP